MYARSYVLCASVFDHSISFTNLVTIVTRIIFVVILTLDFYFYFDRQFISVRLSFTFLFQIKLETRLHLIVVHQTEYTEHNIKMYCQAITNVVHTHTQSSRLQTGEEKKSKRKI